MKKLSNKFSQFLIESNYGECERTLESFMREFYSAVHGFNNELQESRLLEYWKNN